ncbi:MAG TPA: RIP metalloprotease RseP [Terracidiphilus sp.]|jgi:regulator of sigma E protease
MQYLHGTVVAIIAFIVLIGIMVVVHEFGHFAVAKLCGVRVEAFSIGFGPRLFGIKKGDTDYKICLLPLGGYVKMTGETPDHLQEGDTPEDAGPREIDPGSFNNHPRWQRMLIGVAGPIANFILAFVLMAFYFAFINEKMMHEVKETAVEWVVAGTPGADAGFKPGDIITSFATDRNPDWELVIERASLNLGQTVPAVVERNGAAVNLSITLPAAQKGQDLDPSTLGLLPQYVRTPINIKEVEPNTPAAAAGLRAGDAIQAVDGHEFHTVESLLAYMQAGKGTPITLTVLRNGAPFTVVAHPARLDNGWKLGFAWVPPPMQRYPMPVGRAVREARSYCVSKSTLIFEVLGGLFTRRVAMSQLAGPVGIARMAGEAAEMPDYQSKFGLAAAISINLGILNLMPFPILDGGLILLLLIESMLRHDISIAIKERVYQAAFVVLVVFFAFVIFNDVTKLPLFTHVKP